MDWEPEQPVSVSVQDVIDTGLKELSTPKEVSGPPPSGCSKSKTVGKLSQTLSRLKRPKKQQTNPNNNQKQKVPNAPAGTSRSAAASRKLNEMVKNGTFKIDADQLQEMKDKVAEHDKCALVDSVYALHVRHSVCGQELKMKEPYNITRWKEHLKRCGTDDPDSDAASQTGVHKKKSKKSRKATSGAGMQPVTTFFPSVSDPSGSSTIAPSRPPLETRTRIIQRPCTGLSSNNDERIGTLLF
ncbi:hypothetical protein K474DRAFT_1708401 [Panus rudis PR-1116 ss-1]|nr:hypothetical protein K474DRAFT_1708401 [Panus rudis PR-1116 ss-1]